jgi:uncharacterized protein (TIGR00730 family)
LAAAANCVNLLPARRALYTKTMAAFSTFKNIAIFGSADVAENSDLFKQVHEMAGMLAKAGVTVVNGGGPGTMYAATKGAIEAGGEVLTVSFRPQDAPFFEGKDGLNTATRDIEARNYPERVALLMENSDAYVMFKGGTGTLSEWAMVWLMSHIYYGHHKPFVLVGEFWHELIAAVKMGFFIDAEEEKVFRIVATNAEVIPALQALESHLLQLQTQEQRGRIITPGAVAPSVMDEARSDVITTPGTPVSPVGPPPAALPTAEEEEAQRQVSDYIKSFLAGHPNGTAS